MIAVARPGEGRVAVVAPHGVLFRSGAEGRIRERLVRDNLLDAVIGLPAQLFPTTGIPVCIMIFDRSREAGALREHVRDVLFIDASRGFDPGKKQNQLSEQHIAAITDIYSERRNVPKYSYLAQFDDIVRNDFNLNLPRYVDTFELEPEIELQVVQNEIRDLEAQLAAVRSDINDRLLELGIRP